VPNFTVVALKCGSTAPEIAKIGIFVINLPLNDFYKIWHGGGSLRSAPSCQILPLWLKKYGLTAPKIVKNGNFWYKLVCKGKSVWSIEKIEYRCTTTNLPLCIIVSKITLHNSVYVIANFVIPKCDKKTAKKHHTFSSTAGARPTIPTILRIMVIEEVRAIFAFP